MALCEKVPYRMALEIPTIAKFLRVAHPFVLGSARGYSSTVNYSEVTAWQIKKVAGLPTQLLAPSQSIFFPNYEIVKGRTKLVVPHFGEAPHDQLETVLETAPWDEMWNKRVRHIFLFDPSQLSTHQVNYLELIWTFMFTHRKQYWTRTHWLAIPRDHCPRQLRAYYDERHATDHAFYEAWKKLRDCAPHGISWLIWSEPAFWYVPDRSCTWIIRSVDTTPIIDQLKELDELEPIRANWTTHPGRFVETLLAQQLELLDAQQGQCWEVVAP